MTAIIRKICVSGISLGLTLLSVSTLAQTEEEVFNEYFKDWYQVELIIFERIEIGSDDPELWPKNLSLTYPPQLEFLHELQTEDDADDNIEVDPRSENTETPEQALAAGNNQDLLETLKRSDMDDPLNKKYLDSVEKAELERMTPTEQPYTILEASLSALSHEAKLLGRDRNMRLLAHKTWRQPMTGKDNAPSLVMTGGDAFGEHYELEGSIRLYVSRYLHLNTNLWLTQFEANIDQETEHWPALPLRPEPIAFEEPILEDALPKESSLDATEGTNSNTGSLTYETAVTDIDEETKNKSGFGLSYQAGGGTEFGEFAGPSLLDNIGQGSTEQAPYVIRHIVSMKQNRRMRSGEVHYLDHPKLGIIINIEKYEPEFTDTPNESLSAE